jgi:hypothetical protein
MEREGETYHDGKAIVIDAVIVDRRLKQVRVFLKPDERKIY